jgi:hypothetical protein
MQARHMEQTYDVFWDWTLNNGRAFHPVTVQEGGEPENLVVSGFPCGGGGTRYKTRLAPFAQSQFLITYPGDTLKYRRIRRSYLFVVLNIYVHAVTLETTANLPSNNLTFTPLQI